MADHASDILAGKISAEPLAAASDEAISFEDADLVARSRKGDMEAFGLLVTKYQHRVFNVIFRMVGRRADAEELAQDVFLKAMERLSQFRGQSKFYTWLFRIAANLAISHRRRDGRVKFQSLTRRDDDGEAAQAEELTAAIAGRRVLDPHDGAAGDEIHRIVAAAVDELEDEYRVVVVLRDVEDLDYAQIAEVLELPVGTIKSRLHRARCLLRNRLTWLIEPS
ncbi:MAG: sigma-70 family RNA polymerase sigma factor [Planctomycetaceae bacterium]|nr:sigma-70 family RNA polymerase sigma factor [Planctomycetaceae bacterium]